jgi:hypothetical protein
VVPRIPLESIEKSLREQCGDVASLIARVKESYGDVASLIARVKESYEFKTYTQGPDPGQRSITGDQHPIYTTSTWEPPVKKMITARATHYALLYKDIAPKASAHNRL